MEFNAIFKPSHLGPLFEMAGMLGASKKYPEAGPNVCVPESSVTETEISQKPKE